MGSGHDIADLGDRSDEEIRDKLLVLSIDAEDERHRPERLINMLGNCRSVLEFELLNEIHNGGVYRAKDRRKGEIVALKKVKMSEINVLLSFHHHPSIVDLKEVIVGSSLDSIFIVMEHDLKGLMETMKHHPFSETDVKCFMLQLFDLVNYLHHNGVIHGDLNTSNLLLNKGGALKICSFGLSRQAVNLRYRAPELLLGAKEYSAAIDMWSLGCIMAELLLLANEPLFNGKTELDQLDKIFRTLGTPDEKIWPGFPKLPGFKVDFVKQRYNRLRQKFPPASLLGRPTLSAAGFDLLKKLLTYDPEKRITAQDALHHPWFQAA